MAWVIDFFPREDAPPVEYSVEGGVLTVNGEAFDFSFLGEGDLYYARDVPGWELWLPRESSQVTFWEGHYRAAVLMPYTADMNLPRERRHPKGVTVESGRVPLPTDEVPDAET